jgi:hypothetical protein
MNQKGKQSIRTAEGNRKYNNFITVAVILYETIC